MKAAPILEVRRGIVTHLRADPAVTSLGTPALDARIYGERTPATLTWPFVRYGQSDAVFGWDVSAPIHVFSKTDYTDEVSAISEAIGESLDDVVLAFADGRKAHLRYLGHLIIPDGAEASAWHGIVRIGARVAVECAS
jgi:hypothetical protein